MGKGPTVRTALLQTPLSARIPGGPPTLQTPMVALTDTSDHQQLPKEEQHVCDFIQDNHPVVGGKAAGGEVLAGLGTVTSMSTSRWG